MYATYTLKKDELNLEFIENLKKMIPTDQVVISVESYDETDYLRHSKKNHEILMESIKNVEQNKNLIEVPFDEILKAANEKD
ncbi:hypothetical protein D9V86_11840 [Bacteroidetes/Chlorobi group bacterium ChocPot_Mid]|nr:MAG: hypothetical protein D9V86_11840 [Bacteroidetes/Chlorobi group bacterium ChocPot_Mid]